MKGQMKGKIIEITDECVTIMSTRGKTIKFLPSRLHYDDPAIGDFVNITDFGNKDIRITLALPPDGTYIVKPSVVDDNNATEGRNESQGTLLPAMRTNNENERITKPESHAKITLTQMAVIGAYVSVISLIASVWTIVIADKAIRLEETTDSEILTLQYAKGLAIATLLLRLVPFVSMVVFFVAYASGFLGV